MGVCLAQRSVAGATDKTIMLRKDVLGKWGLRRAYNYSVVKNKIMVQNSVPALEKMSIRVLL